ncbi:MAG: hypothetical protein AAFW74_11265, partial [Pseudomonadota bacterium]
AAPITATTNVEAIRNLFNVTAVDASAGNFPSQPVIFPAYDAPVVRQVDGERELSMMHWGFILDYGDSLLDALIRFCNPSRPLRAFSLLIQC